MDNTVIVALISSGSSVLVAITALLLNYRGFASLDARMLAFESRVDARMLSLENRVDRFENRVDARLDMMQVDMKDLNKAMTALELDVAQIKDKVGM